MVFFDEGRSRRSTAVRALRVRFWFSYVKACLGLKTTLQVQQRLEPKLGRTNEESRLIGSSKYFVYARGAQAPRKGLVAQAEGTAKGSERVLNHVLWQVLLHGPAITRKQAKKWAKQLDSDVQERMCDIRGVIRVEAGHRFMASLERRAGLDALAALVIIIKLALTEGLDECVSTQMYALLRMLLMLPAYLGWQSAEELFQFFVEHLVPLAFVHRHERMCFEDYQYSTMSRMLRILTRRRLKLLGQDDKKSASKVMLSILHGECEPWFKAMYEPLVGPDLTIGPPTSEALARFAAGVHRQRAAIFGEDSRELSRTSSSIWSHSTRRTSS